MKNKNTLVAGGLLVVAVVAYVFSSGFLLPAAAPVEPAHTFASDYKNAEYVIEGQEVTLINGESVQEAAPGSATKVVTRYFGNELKTDVDGDGREDVVFLLTQNSGGSGTFYYVVAALNTREGYVGSDGYLLGDRIAPQTTEVSQNPRQKNVIVVNYATRAQGEPMSTQPSVGTSAYLKLDPETMQWGVVEPNFEGESR
ncbi:MAG: hypothetical protein WCK46_03425 [Candidatus Adlerbacteria bacterium]